MKIPNDLHGLSQIPGPIEASVAKQPSTQGSSNMLNKTDEAHLSAAAHLVSQALVLPEVRSDKIASVQSALANGTYQVSSSDLAAKVIDHMRLNQK